MDDERLVKRRAYEAAQTQHRAYRERYYPRVTLGGRPPEQVTEEVVAELARLEQASDAARLAWEAARRPLPTPMAPASTPGATPGATVDGDAPAATPSDAVPADRSA